MSRRRRYRHADQDALSLVMIILAIYSAMIAFLVWAAKSIVTLINRLISASKKKKLPVVQSTDSQTETRDRLIEPTPTENKPTLTNREFPLSDSELVPAAIEIVVEARMASTSLLQRKLKVGYATAARCIDEMERMGIVGPFEGSNPRQVLLSKERYLSLRGNDEFELGKNLPAPQIPQ